MSKFSLALLLFAVVVPTAMRLRVLGASVLIHLIGSHGMGFRRRPLSLTVANLIGILTLNVSVDDYKKDHLPHHANATFARAGMDPDAASLHDRGFRPGTAYRTLWRRLWWTLVSPGFHARSSWTRLRGVFGAGPAWRRLTAWTFWSLLLGSAWHFGLLFQMLIGFVLPLLVFGNIGALLELASEHRWMVGTSEGRERQAQLSHGRFPGTMPPEGRGIGAWSGWVLAMVAGATTRFAVVPGDLPHHDSHHLNRKPRAGLDRWGWTNAALEYSPDLWEDEARQRQATTSIFQAIDRWFVALSQEQPDQPCGPKTAARPRG